MEMKITPHINPKAEIAPRILLPGDPLRAKYVAENMLENAEQFNEVRGALGFTGTYKGEKVSVMGTGMGMPQVSIYVTELMKFYGVKTLIRIGTCGGMLPDMQLMDLILGTGACTTSGINRHIFNGDFAPTADFELLNKAYEIAKEREIKTYTGLILSSDMFYGENKKEDGEMWKKYGVIAGEMEAAALYTIAAKYRCRALTMLSVSDGPFIDRDLTYEEKEKGLKNMFEVALDTAIAF